MHFSQYFNFKYRAFSVLSGTATSFTKHDILTYWVLLAQWLEPGPQRDNRRPGAKWSSRAPLPQPSDYGLSAKRVSFRITVRPLRHFEEFLWIRPLQFEAPQSTRPWGNLPPLSPLSAGLGLVRASHQSSEGCGSDPRIGLRNRFSVVRAWW